MHSMGKMRSFDAFQRLAQIAHGEKLLLAGRRLGLLLLQAWSNLDQTLDWLLSALVGNAPHQELSNPWTPGVALRHLRFNHNNLDEGI